MVTLGAKLALNEGSADGDRSEGVDDEGSKEGRIEGLTDGNREGRNVGSLDGLMLGS